jgi:hypothetical protein
MAETSLTVRLAEFQDAHAWLAEELSVMEYLNDAWSIDLAREEPWGGADGDLEVLITWRLVSLHDGYTDVTFRRWVDVKRPALRRDVEGLHRAIFYGITEMETHERLEGLRSRGRPCFDPHPDGPRIPRVRL